ncbi:hypothetical protein VKT23_017231 [Stygiomarasmius scandens]|uniref:Heterokaryon incompatibility domain-containing protein n=1 Tax=Marasmiellus scandens TaxID=2682957 RepID=A0ABR1ISD3_9AGAR
MAHSSQTHSKYFLLYNVQGPSQARYNPPTPWPHSPNLEFGSTHLLRRFSSPYSSHRLVYREPDGTMIAIQNPTSPALMVSDVNLCPRRLVNVHSLKLVEFDKNDTVPPYAILSHRWCGEETKYAEFCNPQQETFSKLGYSKIRAACQWAFRDGILYIWVDTCCIQQGNHDDVTANVSSMYAYYQNAEVCYAYLADVKETKDMFGKRGVEGGSEWFKRGWTLQELVAPRTVIFFNRNWQVIGDKCMLRNEIHLKTTIPPAILSGKLSVRDVHVLTRMSWGTGRETTKPQDRAYCLQGLLGVSVEPDYNEPWTTSWNRLGQAFFDAHPELKAKPEIVQCTPESPAFYIFLAKIFSKAQNSIIASFLGSIQSRLCPVCLSRRYVAMPFKHGFYFCRACNVTIVDRGRGHGPKVYDPKVPSTETGQTASIKM